MTRVYFVEVDRGLSSPKHGPIPRERVWTLETDLDIGPCIQVGAGTQDGGILAIQHDDSRPGCGVYTTESGVRCEFSPPHHHTKVKAGEAPQLWVRHTDRQLTMLTFKNPSEWKLRAEVVQ